MINPNNDINELASSSTTAATFDQSSVQELVSNHAFSDHFQLINELPKLDSPSKISTNLASSESNFVHHNSIIIGEKDQYHEDGSSNNSSSHYNVVDWKNLDSLLASQLTDSTTSFAHYSNFPSSLTTTHENGMEKESQNHVLGCFPDL